MKIIDDYIQDIRKTLELIPTEKVEEVIDLLRNARMNRKQIFIMGNGGSAATASHFVCDLAKNTRQPGWPGFRVIGLTDNMSIFSAYANDEGYENVFKQQLNNLLQPGDIVVAISGSGNSQNVVEAVEFANKHGAVTVGLTGMTGGMLKNIAQLSVHIPNERIEQVEDAHLIIEHMICSALTKMAAPLKETNSKIIPGEIDSTKTNIMVKNVFSKDIPQRKNHGGMMAEHRSDSALLAKISHEFASKLDLHDLLARILCQTVEYLGALGGSIIVLDETGEVVDAALAYAGQIQEQDPEKLDDTVHHGLAGWVLENKLPALIENTREDPRWMPRGWEVNLDLSRSAICVPLHTQDRVIGVLTLTRMQNNRFTMEDLSLLTSITLALSYSFTARSKVKDQ